MTKKLIVLITMILAAVIVFHGCYTIIKHPSIMQGEAEVDSDHAGGNRDCVSCHQDYHQYPYGYYYSYYPDYYWNYPRWGGYYAYPWWWDNYWYKTDNTTEGTSTRQGDKPARRRGMEPPYARDIMTKPVTDSTLPPPIFNSGTTTPPVIAPGGGTSTGGTVTNPPDKPKDEPKKEEQKPPKRRGGK